MKTSRFFALSKKQTHLFALLLLPAICHQMQPAFASSLWGAKVKVQVDKRVIPVGKVSRLTFNVTKDPIVMVTYCPLIPFTDNAAASAERVLEILAKGKVNALCLPWNGNRRKHRADYERFIDLAHRKGFSVLLLPGPYNFPDAGEFYAAHPEVLAVDQNGKKKSFCINNPTLRAHFRDWMERYLPRNADAVGFDEPTYPRYTETYRSGRLFCYCEVCRDKFRERYGHEMPVLKLPEDRTRKAQLWKEVLQFRRDSMTDWLDFFSRTAKELVPGIATIVDFYSDNISYWIPPKSGWFCAVAEAQAIDVHAIVQLQSIDCVYMNTNSARAMRRAYRRMFVELPHKHGKFAHFFAGFLRPYAMPGAVTRQLDAAMDAGADGIALWSPWVTWRSRADRQRFWKIAEKYALEDYLAELAKAVEVHKGTPIEHARLVLSGCGVKMEVEGNPPAGIGSDGKYVVEIQPKLAGALQITVYYLRKVCFDSKILVK